jgi:hypothetical protein
LTSMSQTEGSSCLYNAIIDHLKINRGEEICKYSKRISDESPVSGEASRDWKNTQVLQILVRIIILLYCGNSPASGYHCFVQEY